MSMFSIVTALLLSFAGVVLLGPVYIGLLSRLGFGKQIRTDGPEGHVIKAGTPTMGGMLMVIVVMFLAMALHIEDVSTLTPMLTLVGVGTLGAIDDFVNIRTGFGMRGRYKLVWQTAVALLAGWYIQRHFHIEAINIPLSGELVIGGLLFVLFVAFVIVGASNAVNLTDGLDGLAIVPVMIAAATFGLIAYLIGNVKFASYLQIHYVAGTGELAVICGALIGAGLGFLWFNAPPATIFMGDTGSLALGGALGTIAVAAKHEIVLAIVGGLFVLETASVIIQVASFKLTGKRVFRMAPLHHHYEQKGWKESTVVVRFWIISVILALVGLASLKLR